jgi:hypothetical protein
VDAGFRKRSCSDNKPERDDDSNPIGAGAGRRRAFLTFKQALDLNGNVRRGERGCKIYFVKRFEVRDQDGDGAENMRTVPAQREIYGSTSISAKPRLIAW